MKKRSMIILYVADQEKSKTFYETVLDKPPVLHVAGMTEFELHKEMLLGLMPNDGIAGIISPMMPHPDTGNGIPRCELYLIVDDPNEFHSRALACGATEICKAQLMNWGDWVAYCADPDGHILAFAK